ncbi:MFS transporter [Tsukamurella strandjordii]|uniref:MFS transporter n=1 Tax=Tsukamurella strandjordii TaxID=147577 RepID=A0AA90NHT3_9ACTN|nr:MFS transporter [Tsukamurella strandjordii]MDP0398579.1 MFS transporter [Tsukamurella strandjordii]
MSSPSATASRIAMATMIGCSLVVMLDNTIITVALPTIAREFALTTAQMQWVVDAYTVVFAGMLLTAGAVADRFGKVRVLVAGIALFTVTSMVIPFVSGFLGVAGGRAVLGLAAAMVYPPTLGIVVDLATRGTDEGADRDQRRASALALWATAGGLGVACGPIVGGLLVEHFGWRSVFVMNVPLGVGAMLALWAVRSTLADATTETEEAAPIGPVSAVLSVLAIGTMVLAVIEAPADGWTSRESVNRYVIAAAVGVLFAVQQARTSRPIVPWQVFRGIQMRWGSAVIFLCFGLLFGLVFILVLYFQIVRGASPPTAGAMLLPFAAGMAVASPLGPVLGRRTEWRVPIIAGLTVMAIGFALFRSTPWEGSYWGYPFFGLLVLGVGFAVVQVPATEYIMNSVAPQQFGIGSAVNDTSRELGGAFGVAILGSVFATALASRAGLGGRGDAMGLLLEAGPDTPGSAVVLQEYFVPAMQTCLLIAIVAVAVTAACAAALLIRSRLLAKVM